MLSPPRHGNDRLLLGLEGSLSEYELDLMRHRTEAGRRVKTARGELLTMLPAGYIAGDDGCLSRCALRPERPGLADRCSVAHTRVRRMYAQDHRQPR